MKSSERSYGVCVSRVNVPEVTDAGLATVAGFSQLEVLDLFGTGITGEGLQQLQSLSRLRSLDLRKTAFKSLDLMYLLPLVGLEYVYFDRKTSNDDEATEIFRSKLPQCKINIFPPGDA